TIDDNVAPTKVTDTIYRYKVNVNPGTSALSRVIVEYQFIDQSWNERPKGTSGAGTAVVITDKDANPATPEKDNINDPDKNPNLRQPLSIGAQLQRVLRETIQAVPPCLHSDCTH